MYFIARRESFAEVDFHAFGCLGSGDPFKYEKEKKKKNSKNIVTHGTLSCRFLGKETVLLTCTVANREG